MATSQYDKIASQFGPAATDYLGSAVHAGGADLQRLKELAQQLNARQALDLGCGAGHASFALSAHVQAVTAYDLAPDMLEVVQNASRTRGLNNISTRCGVAEILPFEDDAFDLVCTRYSAHHWSDVPKSLVEARRVLRPGGTLIVMDIAGFDEPVVDTHLQAIEVLRDPSHVRDYTVREWHSMLQGAGFAVANTQQWRIRLEFQSWVARMRTPAVFEQAIRALISGASEDVKKGLQIEDDGSFHPASFLIEAH